MARRDHERVARRRRDRRSGRHTHFHTEPPLPFTAAEEPGVARIYGMISPRVDRLLENVDSPYASVIVAAKRARQINSYYHNLGEGTFEEFPPPMVDTGSKNYLTIALEEVAGGKVKYRYRGQ
jgi:DNA-directed RNA polymerase subunit omega